MRFYDASAQLHCQQLLEVVDTAVDVPLPKHICKLQEVLGSHSRIYPFIPVSKADYK